ARDRHWKSARKSVRARKNESRRKSAGQRQRPSVPPRHAVPATKIPTSPAFAPDHSLPRGGRSATRRRNSGPVTEVRTLGYGGWVVSGSPSDAAASVESGDLLFLPNLRFEIEPAELQLFSPAIVRSAKNVSFNPHTSHLSGAAVDGLNATRLRGLM